VELREPSALQVASRLKQICVQEKMVASQHTLSILATRSGCDVRTCLNTLQFVRAKTNQLTDEMLDAVPVGRKDAGASAFSLWKQALL
jgi:chromosome transmission fidelity protein 18